MKPRCSIAVLGLLMLSACERVTPTAPSGAALTLTVSPAGIGLGQTATVIATATQSTGIAVPDGTAVYFTTTLGTIAPQTAKTKKGVAEAILTAGTTNGTATVTASSGVSGTFTVAIGVTSASIGTVTLTADPGVLPPGGGQSSLTALVLGVDGQPVSGFPVVFSTTAGTLSSGGGAVSTDSSGRARATLTTDRAATVTARAGEKTATFEARIGSVSSIVVNATPIANAAGGQSQITATVFADNGQTLIGVPVVFATTAGSLSSGGAAVPTDSSGRARDTLTTNRTATVTATAGDKTATVQVTLNTVASIVISANPTAIADPQGGQSVILVTVFGDNGQPFANAPLVFTTTAGTLASNGQLRFTNGSGQATDTLSTTRTATVTVTSGSVSASVQITVGSAADEAVPLLADEPHVLRWLRADFDRHAVSRAWSAFVIAARASAASRRGNMRTPDANVGRFPAQMLTSSS